jgi:hypothetical protein
MLGTIGFVTGLVAQRLGSGFDDPAVWIPDLLTGWALIAAGLVASEARPDSKVGALIVGSGFAWFVPNMSQAEVPWLASIGVVGLFLHRGFLVHALITFSTGRTVRTAERVMVLIGYIWVFTNALWRTWLLTLGLAAALVVATRWRYARVTGTERRRRQTAVTLSVILAAAIGLVVAGNVIAPGTVVRYMGALLYSAAVVTVGAGLAIELRTPRGENPEITDLVVELGQAEPRSIRESLARALGDPGLEIGYWSPSAGEYIDDSGRGLSSSGLSDGSATTTITNGLGDPLALLIHHPSLLEDPALVEAVGSATRLASVNAGLEAELRSSVLELEASRRRLLIAGDDEQRRLEGRLRSGPETRLMDLVSRFESYQRTSTPGPSGDLVEGLGNQLNRSLQELRRLAGGLHPRLLTDVGLTGALEALAGRSSPPAHLDIDVHDLSGEIEAAVYFICSEALANITKHANAEHAEVRVTKHDKRVLVTVTDDGIGGADPSLGTGLVQLADRFEVLGGTLQVLGAVPRGTRLVAELPLGDGR